MTVAVVLAVLLPEHRLLFATMSLGALAGAVVAAEKFRAAEREAAGDEAAAAINNVLWTNAPKLGLVAGALVLPRAPFVVLASVLAGAALCTPTRVSVREGCA